MKAIQLIDIQANQPALVDVNIPQPKAGQCVIKMKAAALNRRDEWIVEGKYPAIKSGVTLGSDGCGVVEEGSDRWLGKKVLINPNINWGDHQWAQSEHYQILGMPNDGTLADYLAVDEDRLVEKPDFLSDEAGAAIPLAGMTAFRACFTQGAVNKNSRVLVTGAGGGVAQFSIAFCLAIGAHVTVASRSKSKIDRTLQLGAHEGLDFTTSDWVSRTQKIGGFDVIIDSIGGNYLNQYLKIIKPGGKIVFYGSSTGRPENMDLFKLFWSQVTIKGSTMASDSEFNEMIQFITRHQIEPVIDKIYSFEDFEAAFQRFHSSDHFGKIVIRC